MFCQNDNAILQLLWLYQCSKESTVLTARITMDPTGRIMELCCHTSKQKV